MAARPHRRTRATIARVAAARESESAPRNRGLRPREPSRRPTAAGIDADHDRRGWSAAWTPGRDRQAAPQARQRSLAKAHGVPKLDTPSLEAAEADGAGGGARV